jgi:hypothetical protein
VAAKKPRGKAAKKKKTTPALKRKPEAPAVVAAPPPKPNAVGRPSTYSQELADTICGRMAEGESLRSVCRDDQMPAISTVMLWRNHNAKFSEQYARAREMLLDVRADEIIDIADDGRNDFMEREIAEGVVIKVVDHEHISRSKLRVDTRKWELSKLVPKRYGDKIEVNGTVTKKVRVVNLTGVRVGSGNGKKPK